MRDDGPTSELSQYGAKTNILHATRAAGMGCMLVAAFCAAIAHAEDTGVKADAKRVGQTVGATARGAARSQ